MKKYHASRSQFYLCCRVHWKMERVLKRMARCFSRMIDLQLVNSTDDVRHLEAPEVDLCVLQRAEGAEDQTEALAGVTSQSRHYSLPPRTVCEKRCGFNTPLFELPAPRRLSAPRLCRAVCR